jgi:hypothetical protein
MYVGVVRTSQETHHVSATTPNSLMLFREIIAVYCENHTGHINYTVKAGGGYSYHCALRC